MRPYNVEIFDQNFNLIHHTNISEMSYKCDYLSPGTNSVTIVYNADVKANTYIRIYRGNEEYFGRIVGVSYADERHLVMVLDYQPIEQIFGTSVIFDTDRQGTVSLESAIAELITAGWINNPDSYQNIPGLTVTTETSTINWTLNIVPSDPDIQSLVEINLYDDIMIPALSIFQILVYADVSIPDKTIHVHIKRQSDDPYYIESDLPSITAKNIVINEASTDINKLIVYNSWDLTDTRVYYLHSNGTYSETDTDRITPVVYNTRTVRVKTPEQYAESLQRSYESAVSTISRINDKEDPLEEEDETEIQEAVDLLNTEVPGMNLRLNAYGRVIDWDEDEANSTVHSYTSSYAFTEHCRALSAQEMQERSDDQAARLFGGIKYHSLIELTMLNDDSLVLPAEMEIGQLVNIISSGVSYASILTAKSISKTTTLTFGTLRLDLTKILKARANNG